MDAPSSVTPSAVDEVQRPDANEQQVRRQKGAAAGSRALIKIAA